MTRDIERFGTNELKIIVLVHDAITRVDLQEYNKLRKVHLNVINLKQGRWRLTSTGN